MKGSTYSETSFYANAQSGSLPSSLYTGLGKKSALSLKDFVSAIDEAPDFQDPFSEVNLFLSQEIKKEMRHIGYGKKWSLKIQERVVEKIQPLFQNSFPQYRLGISALRKTWEKISYYCQQIQSQKQALHQDGKLNVHFLIRENMKQYQKQIECNPAAQHHQYTHQLAMKISECIAIVDGVRPKLDQLTKLIWSIQRNFIKIAPQDKWKSPYEEFDKIDKVVTQTIVEISTKKPQISQQELECEVKEHLHSLCELPSFASLDVMTCNIAAVLAEKLSTQSLFSTLFRTEQKKSMIEFIQRHITLYKSSSKDPHLPEFIRRTISLYNLALKMPKTLSEKEIKEAILSIYPHENETRPDLDQSIYAFISAEVILLKNKEYCYSIEYVTESIIKSYVQAKSLPEIPETQTDLLEMILWKVVSENEGLLQKLPYIIGQKIEEQIAHLFIESPNQNFKSALHHVLQFFKRMKELASYKKWDEIERKVHNWSMQSDMLCRWIKYPYDTPLLSEVIQMYRTMSPEKNSTASQTLISHVAQNYLRKHPELASYLPQLTQHIATIYKCVWYVENKNSDSALDRFMKWQKIELKNALPLASEEILLDYLEEICSKKLPLISFERKFLKENLFSEEQVAS